MLSCLLITAQSAGKKKVSREEKKEEVVEGAILRGSREAPVAALPPPVQQLGSQTRYTFMYSNAPFLGVFLLPFLSKCMQNICSMFFKKADDYKSIFADVRRCRAETGRQMSNPQEAEGGNLAKYFITITDSLLFIYSFKQSGFYCQKNVLF